MTDTVIRVDGLSKRYQLGEARAKYATLRDTIVSAAQLPLRIFSRERRGETQEFWALRDVSFEVKQGEILGVIGHNGAGKSTLLKILSRITEPTRGQVRMRGRVGALLEVGTGFHPELTGRENIYLNGAILGMKRVEIDRKFEEIVDFAEIAKFLDTPVKRYSSGMYMRLAFSIAAHLDPDILFVDEVLAVGDVAFQKKCIGKMGEVAKEGRTVIVVSHNMLSVQGLCSTAMLLSAGKVIDKGNTAQVISRYLHTTSSTLTRKVWQDSSTAPGTSEVHVTEACVRPLNGTHTDTITVCDPFIVEFMVLNHNPGTHLNVNAQFFNENGVLIFETAPVHQTGWLGRPFPTGTFRFGCKVPGNLLNNGIHRISLSLIKNDSIIIHREEDVLMFEVADALDYRAGWQGAWEGAVRPILDWETNLI